MRVTATFATLPAGPMVTQYGVRAPITLDSASLGYPGNYGRPHGWDDAATPKTDNPVRFVPGGFDVGSFIGSSIVRGPATFSR